jgi:hypothetical protein
MTTNYQAAIKGYAGVIQAYSIAATQHETLTGDAWAVMVREIAAALKSGAKIESIRADMKAAEDTWKAQTGATSMPSTYRSAKAVALKAVEGGRDLLDSEGNPKGKTAVEKETKAAESVAKAAEEAEESSVPLIEKVEAMLLEAWPKLTVPERVRLCAFVNKSLIV